MKLNDLSSVVIVQKIIESIQGVAFVYDQRHTVRMGNSKFCELVGVEKERIDGQEITSLFANSVVEILDEMIGHSTMKQEFEKKMEFGLEPRWFRIAVSPLLDLEHGAHLYLFTLIDIHDSMTIKEQLEVAQSISKIGSWHFDLRSKSQTWSSELYKIFEIPEPQNPEDLHRLYRSRFQPEDLARLDALIFKAIEYGEDFTFDHKVMLDSGQRVKFVKGIGKVTKDQNGVPLFVSGTGQDVTQEYERNLHYSNLLNSMTEGFVVHDSTGAVVEYNLVALKVLGLTSEQLLGKTPIDPDWYTVKEDLSIFPGDQHPAAVSLATGKPVSDVIMGVRGKNKELKWLRVNARPYQSLGGNRVIVTFSDITEIINKNMEDRFLFESLKIGIWKLNMQTNDLNWDRSMYDLFELDETQFNGHYSAWENSLSEEAKRSAIDEFNAAVRGDRQFNTTFEIMTKLGKKKMIGGKAVVFKNLDGVAVKMIGINWDKTTEYELSQKLKEASAKSIHSAKLASLGEMAAGIAHEINNPLTIVSGHVSQLRKVRDNLELFEQKVNSVESAIKRIVKIISGLREFSRVPEGTNRESCSVEKIMEDSLVICGSKAKNLGVTIELDLEKDLKLLCDSIELEQVIVNLVNNSVDAISKLKDKWIRITAKSEVDSVVIQIMDSGPGISPEVEQKLFQPFFTTKPIGKGTGLGLSISKSILEAHHAQINYKREFKNTCFEIRFLTATNLKKVV